MSGFLRRTCDAIVDTATATIDVVKARLDEVVQFDSDTLSETVLPGGAIEVAVLPTTPTHGEKSWAGSYILATPVVGNLMPAGSGLTETITAAAGAVVHVSGTYHAEWNSPTTQPGNPTNDSVGFKTRLYADGAIVSTGPSLVMHCLERGQPDDIPIHMAVPFSAVFAAPVLNPLIELEVYVDASTTMLSAELTIGAQHWAWWTHE